MARHKRISPLHLDEAVTELLNEYGILAGQLLGESIVKVAREATEELRKVRRFAPDRTPTGAYSGDWTDEVTHSGLSHSAVVYNMDHYRLAHLLEFGHVTRNGRDRTYRRTPAYPHIEPINDWAQEELIKDVERRLSG